MNPIKKTHYFQTMIHLVLNTLLLRLQFSHLNEHKLKHAFGDTITATCTWGSKVATKHTLWHCHLYSPERLELFENFEKVDSRFLNLNVKENVSFSNFQIFQSQYS